MRPCCRQESDNAPAIGGLVRCLIATGELDRARQTLALAPPAKENDPAIASARAALELAEQAGDLGDVAELSSPRGGRSERPSGPLRPGPRAQWPRRREEAADHLLEIIRRKRDWNDEAARKQLVQFFEAWGPTDPATNDAPAAAVLDAVLLRTAMARLATGPTGRQDDLPETIPVFPLAGALLLPRADLPLNIFEPRYLAMIDDVLSGHRLVGMVQP